MAGIPEVKLTKLLISNGAIDLDSNTDIPDGYTLLYEVGTWNEKTFDRRIIIPVTVLGNDELVSKLSHQAGNALTQWLHQVNKALSWRNRG